jgi:hypothetical protein
MTRALWVAATAAVLGLAACGSDNNDNGGSGANKPAACTPPATATVKFSTDVHPLLQSKCGTCHGDAGTLPKFGSADVATSYAAVKADVDTANPAASKLLVKGLGGASHGGGAPLTTADAQKIQQWITECAQNN